MGNIEQKIHTSKNGTDILIRDAKPKDAAKIISINKKIIDEKFFMLREPEEANYTIENEIRNIENHLRNSESLYIVAETETKDEVTGFLEIQNGSLNRTSHTAMFSMFIQKEYRESGIGSMLLRTLLSWAEKNSVIEKVTLAVFSTNERAINLYKKSGFTEEGRCPRDMKLKDGTYIDSILMYKFVK